MSNSTVKLNDIIVPHKDNNGIIDLRKEPDYDQYKMICHHDYENFIEQCNALSKLGWVPAFPVFTKGEHNNYYAQQWVLKVKKEITEVEQKPINVKIVGTVSTKVFESGWI
jgi:hypothetical protein